MKISIAAFLLIASSSQANATKLARAGFIDCEVLGDCAPAPPSKNPSGFVGNVDMDALYSFDQLYEQNMEVETAKKQMAQHKLDEAKRQAEEKQKKLQQEQEKKVVEVQKQEYRRSEDDLTLQMEGQVQTVPAEMEVVDVPGDSFGEDVSLILMRSEPKSKTASNIEDGASLDEKNKTNADVDLAKRTVEFQESNKNRLKAAKQQLEAMKAKKKAMRAQKEQPRDGFIHRDDGKKITKTDPSKEKQQELTQQKSKK